MRAPLPEAFLRLPIAHRALHDRAAGRPENSPGAIRAAIEAGYGIEIDLQLSADGVPMVFHDETLDRLTAETGPLAARTAAELRAIPLRDAADTIPTLAEVLELVAGRVPLLIEIKDQDGALGPAVGALEAATAAALEGYGGPAAVMSFNPQSMAEMARLRPDLPRGLVTSSYDPTDWRRCRPRPAPASAPSPITTGWRRASSRTRPPISTAPGWPSSRPKAPRSSAGPSGRPRQRPSRAVSPPT